MSLRPPLSVLGLLSSAALVFAADPRGDNPDAKLVASADERASFHLPPGFEIQLVASEPMIEKPFNIAFDSAGRVWVTGSKLYPWAAKRDALGEPIATFDAQWGDTNIAFRAASTPPEPPERGLDSLRVLSDFDPATGLARKSTVFAEGLNIPIGVLPLPRAPGAKGDTVIVFSIPAIWRLTDTDGDGRADVREKLYDGFGFKDTHGMSSNYWLWFDGWVYGTHGYANTSEVKDRTGRVVKLTSGNTYRFRPDGSRFEVYVNGQTNPFGLAFDARGDLFTADSHSKPVYLLVPGGYYEGIAKEHDGLGFAPPVTLDDHGSSAIAGIANYAAMQFPPEFRGNTFNGNPVTRRVNRDRLEWRGSSPSALRQPDFVTSDDQAFRPVQVKLGPDGAIWIADFYNPIIGHYEAPLTHPARDHAHGRIWRIVWRGLDGNIPLPVLPNLAQLNATELVSRFADSNLVVRSLAANEFFARAAAAADAAAPSVALAKEGLARLVAGADPTADETVALPLFFALERLGRADDMLLRRALTRSGSDVAVAALRVLAAREKLPDDAEELFAALTGSARSSPAPVAAKKAGKGKAPRPVGAPHVASPGLPWRIIADILRTHPQPWAGPLLLSMLARTPEPDFELNYALRLSLKTQALVADAAALRTWADADAAAANSIAEVCLAVPTPAAAEFLLGHLEKTKFAGTRAGDFARHAVTNLPADRFNDVLPLLRSLEKAPVAQRVALADGLAGVAAKPGRTLPAAVDMWMRRELVGAIGTADNATSNRAINAVRPLALPEKAAPLRHVATARGFTDAARNAALRALDATAPDTEKVLLEVMASNASVGVRRTVAELLGTANASADARRALAAGFATAPADLSLTLATALAKSEAGAAELLDLAAAGKVRAALLKHRYVALALEKRTPELRARVDAFTRTLPPEDARLDAVIAARGMAAVNYKTDAARGAPLFVTHCSICHRFRDQGGNIGPSLDGIASRPVARLIEDILDPNRNVDPAFRLTTVTLKNGDTKSGLNYREEGNRVLLTDPATAQAVTVAKSDIASTAVLPGSPMPAAFETVLSEQEFFDLLEYLRSPAK